MGSASAFREGCRGRWFDHGLAEVGIKRLTGACASATCSEGCERAAGPVPFGPLRRFAFLASFASASKWSSASLFAFRLTRLQFSIFDLVSSGLGSLYLHRFVWITASVPPGEVRICLDSMCCVRDVGEKPSVSSSMRTDMFVVWAGLQVVTWNRLPKAVTGEASPKKRYSSHR